MDTIGIDELEMAINQWRVRRAQPLALCREVRVLADVYGDMIYRRQSTIAITALSVEQLNALRSAKG